MSTRKRELHLEAIRGAAAVVVLIWHTSLAFYPAKSGIFPNQPADQAIAGNPIFVLMNGTAAVYLFFVLSGYVLSRTYLLNPDDRSLAKAAIKRWPRLAGPVVVTVLFSYVLLQTGAYHYVEAGRASGSPWLAAFAYGMDPDQKYDLSFLAALYQGAFFTFFRGDSYFDSSLWTMRPEFFGSFVVFGLTAVAGGAKRSGAIPSALVVFTAIFAAYFSMIDIIAFIVGMSLALYLPKRRTANAFLTLVLIAAALYLLGYPGRAVGYYSPLVLPPSFTTFPLVAGAALLISAFETSAILPTKFSGKLSHYIGEFSFPLYLVHVPIISSVGSWTYLSYGPRLAVLVSIVASVAAALPLLVFNRNWLAIVNRITERTMRRGVHSSDGTLESQFRPGVRQLVADSLARIPRAPDKLDRLDLELSTELPSPHDPPPAS